MRLLGPSLLAALLVSSPALAQSHAPYGTAPGPALPGIGQQLGDIRDHVRAARRSGQLSPKEAKALRREADQIDSLADRYSAAGTSESEQAELQQRADALRSISNAQRIGQPE